MRPKPIVDGFKTDQHASQCKGFKISAEVVAPLGGLKRQRSYQEPFNISVYLKIFEDAFLTPTVVYDLPLSTGRLEMSIFAERFVVASVSFVAT